MPFDWKQYLDLARELAQPTASDPGQREARLRSAISRAYYASFCHARNYSRNWLKFVPDHTADDHGRLKAHLRVGKRHGIALKLDQLRQWRNDADYQDSLTSDLATMASHSVNEASKILDLMRPPKNPTGT